MEAKAIKRGRGRPKGSVGQNTKDVRDLARRHAKEAVAELWKLGTTSKDLKVRLGALQEILDRAYGRVKPEATASGEQPVQGGMMLLPVVHPADWSEFAAAQMKASQAREQEAIMALEEGLGSVREVAPAPTPQGQEADA